MDDQCNEADDPLDAARSDTDPAVEFGSFGGVDRRTFLSGTLATALPAHTGVTTDDRAAALAGLSPPWAQSDGLPNTLRITKAGAPEGVARYEVTVSGDLEATESFESGSTDAIDGDTATGRVGPESGTDVLRYSGTITAFSLDGPVDWQSLVLDGRDTDSRTDYRLRVAGQVVAGEGVGEGDEADQFTAEGFVRAGVDRYLFTGDLTSYTLEGGDAVLEVEGERVATAGDAPRVERLTPVRGAVTVPPDARLLFEVVVTNSSDRYPSADWFLDGEELDAQYPTISWHPHHTVSGLSAGTHEVRAEVYGTDRDDSLGDVAWTVDVQAGERGAPSAERVDPEETWVQAERGTLLDLTTAATATADDLHRALWFAGAADDPIGATALGGSRDRATISKPAEPGIPVMV